MSILTLPVLHHETTGHSKLFASKLFDNPVDSPGAKPETPVISFGGVETIHAPTPQRHGVPIIIET